MTASTSADFTVASRSDDSAIVTLLLTTHQDPQTCEPAIIRSLLTDLWIREADGWRLALRHSGPAGGDVAGQFAKTDPPPPRWERTGELSLVATGGNTDTQTLGAGAGLIWRPGVWTTRARAVYVRSATNDALTAESLLAELRQARRLTPRAEIFARAEYLVDRFAGVNDRLTVDGGFGWRFIDRAPHTLNLDGSFGATHESRLTGRDLTFAAATATAALPLAAHPPEHIQRAGDDLGRRGRAGQLAVPERGQPDGGDVASAVGAPLARAQTGQPSGAGLPPHRHGAVGRARGAVLMRAAPTRCTRIGGWCLSVFCACSPWPRCSPSCGAAPRS